MLAVLAMTSMAVFTVAVFAPEAAPEIGVAATHIGVFTALVYLFAMLSGVLTGSLVTRYGGIRVCQGAMLATAAGIAAMAMASPLAALLSAVLIGIGHGQLNPASGHILAGAASARWRPLIFLDQANRRADGRRDGGRGDAGPGDSVRMEKRGADRRSPRVAGAGAHSTSAKNLRRRS